MVTAVMTMLSAQLLSEECIGHGHILGCHTKLAMESFIPPHPQLVYNVLQVVDVEG